MTHAKLLFTVIFATLRLCVSLFRADRRIVLKEIQRQGAKNVRKQAEWRVAAFDCSSYPSFQYSRIFIVFLCGFASLRETIYESICQKPT
jgi:hypothetical protein